MDKAIIKRLAELGVGEESDKNSHLTKMISLRRGQIIKETDEIFVYDNSHNNNGHWEVINRWVCGSLVGSEYRIEYGIIRRLVEVEDDRPKLHKLLDELCDLVESTSSQGIFGKTIEIRKEWKRING